LLTTEMNPAELASALQDGARWSGRQAADTARLLLQLPSPGRTGMDGLPRKIREISPSSRIRPRKIRHYY